MVIKKLILNEQMKVEQESDYSGYHVIGAGLPRTGTLTTHTALGQLLKGKCYHMVSVTAGGLDEVVFWEKALRNEVKREDWIQHLQGRGFSAGVDYPISLFYKELMDIFPNAKVLLTVRDPVKWYESVKNTIYYAHDILHNDLPTKTFTKVVGSRRMINVIKDVTDFRPKGFKYGMMEAVGRGQETAVQFFNQWVAEVKATVPKKRLLVFEVKEGWDPLCKLLAVPKPDAPFPRVNDTAKMRSTINRLYYVSNGFALVVLILLVLLYLYVF